MSKSTFVRVLFSTTAIFIAAIVLNYMLRAGYDRSYSALVALLSTGSFVGVVMGVSRLFFGKDNYLK